MTGLIEQAGLMATALCASMDTARLEDWILDQIDRGIDVLVNNEKSLIAIPEKTRLHFL